MHTVAQPRSVRHYARGGIVNQAPSFERDNLLSMFGTAKTAKVTERLKRFAFVPHSVVDRLVGDALSENWGTDDFVLYKYLAVHIPWAIEQERFSHSDNQLYLAAG